MKKSIFLAVFAVAVIAMPAAASVQNIKVSGDIDSTWIVRDKFDLGQNEIAERFYQNFLMTQTRVRVDADLTDNVATTVGLINERTWGEDQQDSSNGDNDIDLNLAFVTLKEMLYSPLTVTIGRQSFAFGNSFVIDSAGTNNNVSVGGLNSVAEDFTKRTAQDAVRMTFDYNPLTIDLIASKVDENNALGTGAQDDDVDLFGTNANYQLGDSMDTVIEAYFWSRIDQSLKGTDRAGAKADTVYMPGVRVATNPIKGLNVSTEVAWQGGNKNDPIDNTTTADASDNLHRNALAAQFIANYLIPLEATADWSPTITGAYTYVSGDSNPVEDPSIAGGNKQDTYTAWDPMFENQAGGTIYNTLFDLSNANIITVITEFKPIEDVTAHLQYDALWVDKVPNNVSDDGTCSGACFTMRQPDGSTTSPTVSKNSKVGDEIGIGLTYDYTEDVRIGAKAGWFIPGNMFHESNEQVASQYIVNANVNF